ncbi:MAG: PASTA domain-containing protein, partial [Planctomycetota bacterium]
SEANAVAAVTAVDNLTSSVTDEYSDTVAAGLVISQTPAPNTPVAIGSSVNLVVSLGQPEVPNVIGMTEPNATTAITGVDNLTVGTVSDDYSDTIAVGLVAVQNPVAGTAVPIGSSVDIVISLGPPVVPDVVGMAEPNALAAITGAGLVVGNVSYEYNDIVGAGIVISQIPADGVTVAVGSAVDLVISLGQPEVRDVRGMTQSAAYSAITAVDNLSVGEVSYEYSDTVNPGLIISQDPAGGTVVSVGSSVDLVVSLGPPVVPGVVGISEANAVASITAIDNLTTSVTYEYSDTVAASVIISQDPSGATVVAVGSNVDLVVSLGQPEVPNVVGMSEANATVAITAVDNLTVGSVTDEYSDTVATGLVVSHIPAPNTAVAIGSSVDLVVSLGQPEVPDVVGMTEANATTAITAVDNLTVGSVTDEYSDTVSAGLVISQTPAPNTPVLIGSSVNVVVSLGLPEVPDVVWMTEANAVAAITAVDNLTSSVTNEYSDTIASGVVISQTPAPNTPVLIGSSVNLVVSLGQPEVPDVVGMTEANATVAITGVDNLTVGSVTDEYSDTVAAGLVISQTPTPNTPVLIGSSVNLVVSLGQPEVPDVVGMTEANATVAITAVDNLTVGSVTDEYSDTVAAGLVVSQIPAPNTPVVIGSSVNLVVSLGQPEVPDVVGMTEANATVAITGVDNLTVGSVTDEYSDTVAAGLVISQTPAPNTPVLIGSSVNLVVSLGLPEVPDVVGMTEANATAAITAVDNLTVGSVTDEYSDTVSAGLVTSQTPAPNTPVAIGSSVNLVVSLGQPEVPDVVGMTEANATVAITAVDNLTVGSVTDEYSDAIAAGLVISQTPAPNTPVLIGSSVNLVASLGLP